MINPKAALPGITVPRIEPAIPGGSANDAEWAGDHDVGDIFMTTVNNGSAMVEDVLKLFAAIPMGFVAGVNNGFVRATRNDSGIGTGAAAVIGGTALGTAQGIVLAVACGVQALADGGQMLHAAGYGVVRLITD